MHHGFSPYDLELLLAFLPFGKYTLLKRWHSFWVFLPVLGGFFFWIIRKRVEAF
ncbi:putative membrane protein [Pseudomonas syringae pv. syringae]|nr:putative membrane protein [Pseudomonas syringae pv. syringae]